MFEHRIFKTEIAGRTLTVEIGKIAEMTMVTVLSAMVILC